MEKLEKEKLNERASNKAFAKIFYLQEDLIKAKKEIKTGGDGRFNKELLEAVYDSTNRELQIWNYIAQLIELDNTYDKSSSDLLKNICGLNNE